MCQGAGGRAFEQFESPFECNIEANSDNFMKFLKLNSFLSTSRSLDKALNRT